MAKFFQWLLSLVLVVQLIICLLLQVAGYMKQITLIKQSTLYSNILWEVSNCHLIGIQHFYK